jgi:hypothetical protein
MAKTDNLQKAKDIAAYFDMCTWKPEEVAEIAAEEMALWKDEQFNQQNEKLKEFENWLYNRQSEYKHEGMYEELVGLNDVIKKFEELGL